jgi:hypothetical protein
MSCVEYIPLAPANTKVPGIIIDGTSCGCCCFFVMCYDKIFDTSGGIMRKKPGMNEWGEYFYSFTRSCPVIILPAKAVNCSDTTNLLIFLCVGHIISRRNAAKSQPPRM